jgi:ribosomal protein S18 acetylase RimI-like enzyme
MTGSQLRSNQLPLSGIDPTHRLIRVGPERQQDAIARLVGGPGARVDAADRFLEFSRTNGIDLSLLWARVDRRDQLLATVLAVPNPGRTVIVFSSPVTSPGGVELQGELIDFAAREMATGDLELAQVLIEPHDALQRDAFRAGGYSELARLSYMERSLAGRNRIPRAAFPDDVTVEPYVDGLRDEMLEALEASYEETLDCPGLRGLRRTEDIFEGHRGTGIFEPTLWTLLRVDGRPGGVLMLNPAPASNTIELVYIGLAKFAQGRGIGRELLRFGFGQLAERSERAVTLAVDDRNHPAITLYRREGFRRVLRRVAMIRSLRDSGSGT